MPMEPPEVARGDDGELGTEEGRRLAEADGGGRDWRLWGTYLPDRQWGTVREDYSADGSAWDSFTYDMARARAYRWGEDGLLGWTDRACRLCFAPALWNGRDAHLKERLFGLSNKQGNHGEDVKELYFHLDATPSGSYAKALYKYPQAAFPYADLIEQNRDRDFDQREYELLDTGVFDGDRYFDVVVEYAKQSPEDTLIRLTVSNRGPERSDIVAVPTLWFRNTWAWDDGQGDEQAKPSLQASGDGPAIIAAHAELGRMRFEVIADRDDAVESIFTENETHRAAPGAGSAAGGFSKDGLERFLLRGDRAAVNPDRTGTKAGFVFRLAVDPGATRMLRLRLVREDGEAVGPTTPEAADASFARAVAEADAFYARCLPAALSDDERTVARQAYAGLLWSRQTYLFDVDRWLEGDPSGPAVAEERKRGRNADWRHVSCRDVIAMPDKWEYPWFAAWDLAAHTIPLARLDMAYAKNQLTLLMEERYMHPNGALPAYEYGFGDVNPPVHATAVLEVYAFDRQRTGTCDLVFLERAFLKLLLNFTWWVNRNDGHGRNLFGGGFLGLDNIGLFDRNRPLPGGMRVEQADATAWMGLFCSAMLGIAVELQTSRPAYADMVLKFLHHYLLVVDAINGGNGPGLWDDEAGFFFDHVVVDDRPPIAMKVQSIVGLVPLFAIFVMTKEQEEQLPDAAMQVIQEHLDSNPRLARHIAQAEVRDGPYAGTRFLSLVPKDRLLRVLRIVLDEAAFLSPFGIRSVSKLHADHPVEIEHEGTTLRVEYSPGEGTNGAFGGNSNWRGPVWFPINTLIIRSLELYHAVYGDEFTVECPVGSGVMLTLKEVAAELLARLARIFLKDASGDRPCHGGARPYRDDPFWKDLVLFNEYFHAETGRGLGASHQTGWTALVATCLERMYGDAP